MEEELATEATEEEIEEVEPKTEGAIKGTLIRVNGKLSCFKDSEAIIGHLRCDCCGIFIGPLHLEKRLVTAHPGLCVNCYEFNRKLAYRGKALELTGWYKR